MTCIYTYLQENPLVYLPLGIIIGTSFLALHHDNYKEKDSFNVGLALVHWYFAIAFWPLILLLIPIELLVNFIRSLRGD
jgi:nitrogen fixation/metabolism regulation signal transduction histidine kinase